MRICNNEDGILWCHGKCYDNGLCQCKYKCDDSLTVNDELIKTLMSESGRHEKMSNKFKQLSWLSHEKDC